MRPRRLGPCLALNLGDQRPAACSSWGGEGLWKAGWGPHVGPGHRQGLTDTESPLLVPPWGLPVSQPGSGKPRGKCPTSDESPPASDSATQAGREARLSLARSSLQATPPAPWAPLSSRTLSSSCRPSTPSPAPPPPPPPFPHRQQGSEAPTQGCVCHPPPHGLSACPGKF